MQSTEHREIVESDEAEWNVALELEPFRPVRAQVPHIVKRGVLVELSRAGNKSESVIVELHVAHVNVLRIVKRGNEDAAGRQRAMNRRERLVLLRLVHVREDRDGVHDREDDVLRRKAPQFIRAAQMTPAPADGDRTEGGE